MIVTVTLNPSLDRTIEIPSLERGGLNRATTLRVEPGGKGVNVARALIANDAPARAVLPLGGGVGAQFAQLLREDGIRSDVVPVRATTRSNITLAEPDGTTTKVNEPGEALTAEELQRLIAAVERRIRPGHWVVLSGSLPAGVPTEIYAGLADLVLRLQAKVAVDSSGTALAAALAARPSLVKPNREELAEIVGSPIDTIDDAIEAADELRHRGAEAVLASLGAEGAVYLDAAGPLVGRCDVEAPRSTVGAGDCLLAGFLAARARGARALLTALRWAAASVSLPGSGVPNPALVARQSPVLITAWQRGGTSLTVG